MRSHSIHSYFIKSKAELKQFMVSVLFMLFLLISVNGSDVKAQKVGVVLSGGGASGMAHIGVLKALEENEIPIDFITGTSMGALVGGLQEAPCPTLMIILSEDT